MRRLLYLFAVGAVLSAAPALAVDGQIEINQARAMAGGLTDGDTPGFPVIISTLGSYRLTGDLALPDENTRAIWIQVSDVTIDLNGFSILGITECGGEITDCAPVGVGYSIYSASDNTTVVNGTIRGAGKDGVRLEGNNGRVEAVRAISNGELGIFVGTGGTVNKCVANRNGLVGIRAAQGQVTGSSASFNGMQGIALVDGGFAAHNTVHENGGVGIFANRHGQVSNNWVELNDGDGIFVSLGGAVVDNTVMSNGDNGIRAGAIATVSRNAVGNNTNFGLLLGNTCAYSNNTVFGNNGACPAAQVSGGVEIGTNLCCLDTTCP